MSHVRHSIHIEAPPEQVWAIGRDPERMPEWNTTVVSVKDADGAADWPQPAIATARVRTANRDTLPTVIPMRRTARTIHPTRF